MSWRIISIDDWKDIVRYRYLRTDMAYQPGEFIRGGEDLDKLCDNGIWYMAIWQAFGGCISESGQWLKAKLSDRQ